MGACEAARRDIRRLRGRTARGVQLGQTTSAAAGPRYGTVTRHREMLRRVLIHIHTEYELLVATPDPAGSGMRAAAWRALIARVAGRQEAELPRVRVVSWSEVCARLGRSVTHALLSR
jgi:hypothetical protein